MITVTGYLKKNRDPWDQKVIKNRKLIKGFGGLNMVSSKIFAEPL